VSDKVKGRKEGKRVRKGDIRNGENNFREGKEKRKKKISSAGIRPLPTQKRQGALNARNYFKSGGFQLKVSA